MNNRVSIRDFYEILVTFLVASTNNQGLSSVESAHSIPTIEKPPEQIPFFMTPPAVKNDVHSLKKRVLQQKSNASIPKSPDLKKR